MMKGYFNGLVAARMVDVTASCVSEKARQTRRATR